jgi:uncharacterized C2H2 Zn-finger protein
MEILVRCQHCGHIASEDDYYHFQDEENETFLSCPICDGTDVEDYEDS